MFGMKSKVAVAMRIIFSVFVAGVVSLLHYGVAFAGDGTGTAEASIIQSAQVTEQTQLNFGNIIPAASAGTVTVDASGNVAVTGGHQVVGSGHSLGVFSIVGQNGQNITVTLPSGAFAITHSNGSDSMNITLTGYNLPTSLAGGVGSFSVGGTLAVGANQLAGVYTGNYTVTVTYI